MCLSTVLITPSAEHKCARHDDLIALWQEEDEADYKQRFPDYHASFADILEDGMEMDEQSGADHQAAQQAGATQAEASSASSKQLMQGQLLDDIVVQHARCVISPWAALFMCELLTCSAVA